MRGLRDTATWLSSQIAAMGPFELLSDGGAIPVFAFRVKDGTPYSVFDLSARLRERGWQIPAYTMPDNAADLAVLRIVVRDGFTRDLAGMLLDDLGKAVAFFTANPPSAPRDAESHFAH